MRGFIMMIFVAMSVAMAGSVAGHAQANGQGNARVLGQADGQGNARVQELAKMPAREPGYAQVKDVSYVDADETDEYRLERCLLDVYWPEDVDGFATLVWFHGGGLEAGSKEFCEEFRGRGFAVVNVNYRLSPKALCPAYIEDAAQAVSWVFNHIGEFGGDADKIYVGGHSAGAYLTLMIGLDKKYMGKYGVDADRIRKLYPVSGQTATHYTIRAERGLSRDIPLVDSLSPLANVRKEGAPIMLITGAAELEMLARYEENAYLYSLLRYFEHPAQLFQLQGCNHGTVLPPACQQIGSDILEDSK